MSEHVPSVGRIVVTLPPAEGYAMLKHRVRVHDAETSEDLGLHATRLIVDCDSSSPFVVADLTMLVDAEGKPTSDTKAIVLDGEGRPRTAVFRYDVAAILTWTPGSLTVNEERAQLGLAPVGPEWNALKVGSES